MSILSALKNHPRDLWILALTELCERYAFGGAGYLLVLYLVEAHQFPDVKATHVYGLFTGFAAFLPLVGGFLADRWNYQAPMLLGALINATGCFLLASGVPALLYPALGVMALGYGIFTPSILTLLGHSYRDLPQLREAGFSIYYAAVNIGVFLALATLGTIGKLIGWDSAFLVAGIVQLLGLCPLTLYLYHHKEQIRELQTAQKARRTEKGALTTIEKDRLGLIALLFLFSILFWMAYNQAFSSMALFAHQFMDKIVLGSSIPEGVFLSSESLFLVVLAPLLAALYARLQRSGRDPSPTVKTSLSLIFLSLCFVAMMWASYAIPPTATQAQVSWGYLVFAYFLMAVGEMLLAPIGLSMVSHLAPRRHTALLMGLWYVCVGLAFYVGGILAGLMERVGGLFHFFAIFVALTLIPGVILLAIAKRAGRLAHE